ncbi:hypothetical protein J7T55_007665 [Diaporthe amygdali]|uniref:uncharacterized protein n=1 Tax=Phomopsis amygdali TaxID=1214568 RepID=UPI0022FE6B87|nr:uncharacterized protein J7T55_007665 [Diaporthe amygdali]KAJ0107476.1 hypothetical protein J7T55_007665 [Diaporthe amygdali]
MSLSPEASSILGLALREKRARRKREHELAKLAELGPNVPMIFSEFSDVTPQLLLSIRVITDFNPASNTTTTTTITNTRRTTISATNDAPSTV